jgi:hypothetical protein
VRIARNVVNGSWRISQGLFTVYDLAKYIHDREERNIRPIRNSKIRALLVMYEYFVDIGSVDLSQVHHFTVSLFSCAMGEECWLCFISDDHQVTDMPLLLTGCLDT